MEKLSRMIWAPPVEGKATQTRWFYDRARGQYKNARNKENFSKAKLNAFDLKNPKSQVFSKEDVAKYINSYQEIVEGKKLLIGPHYVVRGNQKNYVQFMNHNLVKKTDSIYFEDVIAKAILFRSAEKLYGIKPNAIGDMRYITVPYSIAYLSFITKGKLDLYKIWKTQSITPALKDFLYNLMLQVESFIKKYAPGSLYGEWGKKEECWEQLKKQKLDVDIESIKPDMQDSKSQSQRTKLSEDDALQTQIKEETEKLKSISPAIWHNIEEWGKASQLLTSNQQNGAWSIAVRLKNNHRLTDHERIIGSKILDIVIENAPALLSDD
jgi:hypothetical protein